MGKGRKEEERCSPGELSASWQSRDAVCPLGLFKHDDYSTLKPPSSRKKQLLILLLLLLFHIIADTQPTRCHTRVFKEYERSQIICHCAVTHGSTSEHPQGPAWTLPYSPASTAFLLILKRLQLMSHTDYKYSSRTACKHAARRTSAAAAAASSENICILQTRHHGDWHLDSQPSLSCWDVIVSKTGNLRGKEKKNL